MPLAGRSILHQREPSKPSTLTEDTAWRGIGMFVFNGPDTRVIDYAAYLAVAAAVRAAAKAGIGASRPQADD